MSKAKYRYDPLPRVDGRNEDTIERMERGPDLLEWTGGYKHHFDRSGNVGIVRIRKCTGWKESRIVFVVRDWKDRTCLEITIYRRYV